MRAKIEEPEATYKADLVRIRGQEVCKRAMMVAIAGEHSITLIGPEGWGKTMLHSSAAEIASAVFTTTPIRVQEVTVYRDEPFPKLQRTSLYIEVPAVPFHELIGRRPGTNSAYVVDKIRAMPRHTNLDLTEDTLHLLKQAMIELSLNARQYVEVIKIARTIANLSQSPAIGVEHVAEAVQYCHPPKG